MSVKVSDIVKVSDFQDLAKFQMVLDNNPNASWIRKHPIAKDVDYIPIEIIEEMLRTVFPSYKIEVLTVQQIFNAIQVSVRVHLLHPVSKEWFFMDGVGAVPVQLNKGAQKDDLTAIKSNAVTLATPAAKSYAVKDALEPLGKLFGGGLNRSDVQSMASPYVSKIEDL